MRFRAANWDCHVSSRKIPRIVVPDFGPSRNPFMNESAVTINDSDIRVTLAVDCPDDKEKTGSLQVRPQCLAAQTVINKISR